MQDVRPTLATAGVLQVFLSDLEEPQHGYKIIKATGYSGAKTYGVLARLHTAGWLDRYDDPHASPQSGGPPRITYRLRGDAVPKARRLLAEAQKELAPAPARRRTIGGAAHALGWAP
jgi:PadR family transcriptional regulator, regulatory protein PadR